MSVVIRGLVVAGCFAVAVLVVLGCCFAVLFVVSFVVSSGVCVFDVCRWLFIVVCRWTFARCCLLVVGCWSLVVRCWLWLVAVGCC